MRISPDMRCWHGSTTVCKLLIVKLKNYVLVRPIANSWICFSQVSNTSLIKLTDEYFSIFHLVRIGANETSQIQNQVGARIHWKFQDSPRWIQKNGRRQDCIGWQIGQRSLPGQLWISAVVQALFRCQLSRTRLWCCGCSWRLYSRDRLQWLICWSTATSLTNAYGLFN